MAGTMLLVLQDNILADGHDQQLRDKTELWWTNMVVGGLKRNATNASCGSWKRQYDGKRRNTGRRKDNAGGYTAANREQGKQEDWPTCGPVRSQPH